jgi:iron complex transport system ATP-binding protein
MNQRSTGHLHLHTVRARIGSVDFGPFSFDIAPGERIAILGPSGAGKSSLLKLISGEYVATSGTLNLKGRPLGSFGPASLSHVLAVLPQNYQNAFDMPVKVVIGLGRLGKQPDRNFEQIIRRAALLARADHLLERTTVGLSGGELARVHLARVFAQLWDVYGGILLVDEPFAAFDPGLALELSERMAMFARLRGHTLIAVLHDVQVALQRFDRLILLERGQVFADCLASMDALPVLGCLFGVRFLAHQIDDVIFLCATTASEDR